MIILNPIQVESVVVKKSGMQDLNSGNFNILMEW